MPKIKPQNCASGVTDQQTPESSIKFKKEILGDYQQVDLFSTEEQLLIRVYRFVQDNYESKQDQAIGQSSIESEHVRLLKLLNTTFSQKESQYIADKGLMQWDFNENRYVHGYNLLQKIAPDELLVDKRFFGSSDDSLMNQILLKDKRLAELRNEGLASRAIDAFYAIPDGTFDPTNLEHAQRAIYYALLKQGAARFVTVMHGVKYVQFDVTTDSSGHHLHHQVLEDLGTKTRDYEQVTHGVCQHKGQTIKIKLSFFTTSQNYLMLYLDALSIDGLTLHEKSCTPELSRYLVNYFKIIANKECAEKLFIADRCSEGGCVFSGRTTLPQSQTKWGSIYQTHDDNPLIELKLDEAILEDNPFLTLQPIEANIRLTQIQGASAETDKNEKLNLILEKSLAHRTTLSKKFKTLIHVGQLHQVQHREMDKNLTDLVVESQCELINIIKARPNAIIITEGVSKNLKREWMKPDSIQAALALFPNGVPAFESLNAEQYDYILKYHGGYVSIALEYTACIYRGITPEVSEPLKEFIDTEIQHQKESLSDVDAVRHVLDEFHLVVNDIREIEAIKCMNEAMIMHRMEHSLSPHYIQLQEAEIILAFGAKHRETFAALCNDLDIQYQYLPTFDESLFHGELFETRANDASLLFHEAPVKAGAFEKLRLYAQQRKINKQMAKHESEQIVETIHACLPEAPTSFGVLLPSYHERKQQISDQLSGTCDEKNRRLEPIIQMNKDELYTVWDRLARPTEQLLPLFAWMAKNNKAELLHTEFIETLFENHPLLLNESAKMAVMFGSKEYVKGAFPHLDLNTIQTMLGFSVADDNKVMLDSILVMMTQRDISLWDLENRGGDDPFLLAIQLENSALTATLLEHGMHPNVIFDSPAEGSYLHTACRTRNTTIIKMLLEAGGLVNCQDLFKRTPLHLVLHNEQWEIASLMIKTYRADIHVRDYESRTPLDYIKNNEMKARLLAETTPNNPKTSMACASGKIETNIELDAMSGLIIDANGDTIDNTDTNLLLSRTDIRQSCTVKELFSVEISHDFSFTAEETAQIRLAHFHHCYRSTDRTLFLTQFSSQELQTFIDNKWIFDLGEGCYIIRISSNNVSLYYERALNYLNDVLEVFDVNNQDHLRRAVLATMTNHGDIEQRLVTIDAQPSKRMIFQVVNKPASLEFEFTCEFNYERKRSYFHLGTPSQSVQLSEFDLTALPRFSCAAGRHDEINRNRDSLTLEQILSHTDNSRRIIYVITPRGELLVDSYNELVSMLVQHEQLGKGQPVLAAGELKLTRVNDGRFSIEIDDRSGGYMESSYNADPESHRQRTQHFQRLIESVFLEARLPGIFKGFNAPVHDSDSRSKAALLEELQNEMNHVMDNLGEKKAESSSTKPKSMACESGVNRNPSIGFNMEPMDAMPSMDEMVFGSDERVTSSAPKYQNNSFQIKNMISANQVYSNRAINHNRASEPNNRQSSTQQTDVRALTVYEGNRVQADQGSNKDPFQSKLKAKSYHYSNDPIKPTILLQYGTAKNPPRPSANDNRLLPDGWSQSQSKNGYDISIRCVKGLGQMAILSFIGEKSTDATRKGLTSLGASETVVDVGAGVVGTGAVMGSARVLLGATGVGLVAIAGFEGLNRVADYMDSHEAETAGGCLGQSAVQMTRDVLHMSFSPATGLLNGISHIPERLTVTGNQPFDLLLNGLGAAWLQQIGGAINQAAIQSAKSFGNDVLKMGRAVINLDLPRWDPDRGIHLPASVVPGRAVTETRSSFEKEETVERNKQEITVLHASTPTQARMTLVPKKRQSQESSQTPMIHNPYVLKETTQSTLGPSALSSQSMMMTPGKPTLLSSQSIFNSPNMGQHRIDIQQQAQTEICPLTHSLTVQGHALNQRVSDYSKRNDYYPSQASIMHDYQQDLRSIASNYSQTNNHLTRNSIYQPNAAHVTSNSSNWSPMHFNRAVSSVSLPSAPTYQSASHLVQGANNFLWNTVPKPSGYR